MIIIAYPRWEIIIEGSYKFLHYFQNYVLVGQNEVCQPSEGCHDLCTIRYQVNQIVRKWSFDSEFHSRHLSALDWFVLRKVRTVGPY